MNLRPTPHIWHHRQRAFTLMEILLATASFAIILLVVKLTLFHALDLRQRAEDRLRQLGSYQVAIRQLELDLRQALLTEQTLASHFLGEPTGMGAMRADRLEFRTTSSFAGFGTFFGDVQGVEYTMEAWVNDQPGQATEEGFALVRSATRNLLPSLEDAPEPTVLATGLTSFSLYYYDGEMWRDQWDSSVEDDKLPLAVRVIMEWNPTTPRGSKSLVEEPQGRWEGVIPLRARPEMATEGEGNPSVTGGTRNPSG